MVIFPHAVESPLARSEVTVVRVDAAIVEHAVVASIVLRGQSEGERVIEMRLRRRESLSVPCDHPVKCAGVANPGGIGPCMRAVLPCRIQTRRL